MGKTNNRCWQHRTHRVHCVIKRLSIFLPSMKTHFPKLDISKTETFVITFQVWYCVIRFMSGQEATPAQCANGIAI